MSAQGPSPGGHRLAGHTLRDGRAPSTSRGPDGRTALPQRGAPPTEPSDEPLEVGGLTPLSDTQKIGTERGGPTCWSDVPLPTAVPTTPTACPPPARPAQGPEDTAPPRPRSPAGRRLTLSVVSGGLNFSEWAHQWVSTYCFRMTDASCGRAGRGGHVRTHFPPGEATPTPGRPSTCGGAWRPVPGDLQTGPRAALPGERLTARRGGDAQVGPIGLGLPDGLPGPPGDPRSAQPGGRQTLEEQTSL